MAFELILTTTTVGVQTQPEWSRINFSFRELHLIYFLYLEFQAVLLSAVLLDLRVDVLHQCVTFHQHVSEG